MKITVAEALRKKMIDENLNQLQFSQKLKLAPPELNMIMSGKRTASLRARMRIYKAYPEPDMAEVLLG